MPQGLVLGPILFLLYINDDLKVNVQESKIVLFADDRHFGDSREWKHSPALNQEGHEWAEIVVLHKQSYGKYRENNSSASSYEAKKNSIKNASQIWQHGYCL